VGDDRSLRRLAVVALKPVDVEPARPGDAASLDGRRVTVGVPLRDALVAILESPRGVVAVEDGGGNVVGVVRPESIYEASRRSLAPEP